MASVVRVPPSSLVELLDCAHRWYAKRVEKRRGRLNGSAHTGKAVHAATAVFDNGRITGNAVTPADAVDYFVQQLRSPSDEVVWEDDFGLRKAEKGGNAVVARYCHEFSPRVEFYAVELKLEPLEITVSNDLTLVMSGVIDRVRVRRDGHGEVLGVGPVDLKTGKALTSDGRVKAATHAAQLGAYELLGTMAFQTLGLPMMLPTQVIGLDTHKGKVASTLIHGAGEILKGDGVHEGILEHAANIIASGRYVGNPSSRLCSAKYCPAYPCFYVRGA